MPKTLTDERLVVPVPPPKQPQLSPLSWLMIIVLSSVLSSVVILLVTVLVAPGRLHFLPHPGGSGMAFHAGSPGEKVLLVMGVDINYANKDHTRYDGTRTDTMMLVRVSPEKNTISVVSIPRDSKVYLAENHGTDKINAAHAIGGPELAVQTVQDAFGVPIDNYVVVNSHGLRELVDAVGGVSVYVDKPMHYRDRTAKLNIQFEPGYHTLKGEDAEAFLRFRHDAMADIGRIRRQQQFLAALAQKMKSPWMITQLPNLIRLGTQYVETDLTPDEMVRIAAFVKDVQLSQIRVATLPGHPSGGGISYWVIDPEAAQQVLDRLLLDNPGIPASTETDPLKIGILYAPGVKAQADSLMTAIKQNRNFAVSCQAAKRYTSTQIIEHTNRVNDRWTRHLQDLGGSLKSARIIFAPVGTTYEDNTCSASEDYTLILGNDVGSSGENHG